MVCRENKARSTTMGYLKVLLRRAGFGDFSDHELQSMIHEQQHSFQAAADPDPDTYVAYLKGLRQQIVNDPDLSDEQKFRPDRGRASQPGFVTRIDQELERFRTGQYTDPVTGNQTALTRAQMNLGANFAAMARLGQPVARAQHAKEAYCELYARHMGIPMEESRNRLRTLVARPQAARLNTQISLTDDWREKLAVAGLSAQQQADMGQSNQLREALRLMEHERQAKIATLPTRPAIRPEHEIKVLRQEDPTAAVQCIGGCGQFGHTADDCPNVAQVRNLETAERQYKNARAALDAQTKIISARQTLHNLDNGETVDIIDTPDGPRIAAPSGRLLPPDAPELRNELASLADQYDEARFKKTAAEAKKARATLDGARSDFDAARGPVARTSKFVTGLAYNPETGTVRLTLKGYRLKRTGEEQPPKTYLYRMTPDEYEELMASDNFDAAVSNRLLARTGFGVHGGNQRYRFDSAADAEAAKTQKQCPSCGQWASLTTAHSCPISGSMSGADEHRYREQLRAARERAKLAKLPVLTQETLPRQKVMSQAVATLPDKGRLSFPHPRETEQITSKGGVAIGLISGRYLGAQVTGRMYIWRNRGTGESLYQLDQLRCSCGESQCRHLDYAASAVGGPFRARRAYGTPGAPDLSASSKDNTAVDSGDDRADHVPYNAIVKQRAANRSRTMAYMRDSPLQHDNWPSKPRDASGATLEWSQVPSRWSDGGGKDINLNHPDAVADEVRSRLNKKTGRTEQDSNWQVSTDPTGGVWIRSRENIAGPHGKMFLTHQKELAEAFNLPSLPQGRGVYIGPDRAWRHEMLDRLTGVAPRIRAPRMVAGPRDNTGN